jgi:aspartate/methionine/tyrosine aminotransferase
MGIKKLGNRLNNTLLDLDVYTSKAISLQAKNDPEIVNLSFGEPEFGPPNYLEEDILINDLSIASFLDSVKRYESSRGSLELRKAISLWYKRRYGWSINPETEIMITHGGVEAITLAILCTTEVGDIVSITDPSYMLYKRSILALGREHNYLARPIGEYEYKNIFNESSDTQYQLGKSKAIIINSPENPSGYVLDKKEWELIGDYSNKMGLWVIHDEVYDTMAFERQHIPCGMISSLSENFILINSFSKKFGIPGLRIGWIVSNKEIIDLASKIHDYLYLGVNILCEKIATRLISDLRNDKWLSDISKNLQQRMSRSLLTLCEEKGFTWTRKPFGGMFLFPNVSSLYKKIPQVYKLEGITIGNAVSEYLLKEKKVAVVPGSVYGIQGNEHVRLVLCTEENKFNLAIDRLSSI